MSVILILLGALALLLSLPLCLYLAAVFARAGLIESASSEGRSMFRR
ncbi:hypothetical protein LP7551_02707 [Roseibium album]|nr:hypothetical protein LP7551_02707 [Roseibium album]